ncbi:sugar-binding transcriptional regulator [Trueperella pyogenes]|uniref:sugar-binding transcriptional regulator n=1 Tax=Trueperella pyogenes TaxID=1661 RepID=UPI00345D25B0
MAPTPEDLTERDILALDAAKLYYSGKTQAEVAHDLHISRPTVSKLLGYAQRQGFVRISVIDPRDQSKDVIAKLKQRYDLIEVVLVCPPLPTRESLWNSLGSAAAHMISDMVRDGDVIGIHPSQTMSTVAEYLQPSRRKNLRVVQLAGGLLPDQDNQQVVARFASSLGAICHTLPIPAFVHSVAVRNRLAREEHVRPILALGTRARIAIFTVGSFEANLPALPAAIFSRSDIAVLRKRAVGDICGRFIDTHGRVCIPDINNKTFGISLPDLRRKEQKLLVAGGEDKTHAIFACLENGYANRAVIDYQTAHAVLQLGHD